MSHRVLPVWRNEPVSINNAVSVCRADGRVFYFQNCLPVFTHAEDDLASFRMFTSQLVASGSCKQVEIAKAFGVTPLSVKRSVKKYRKQGPSVFFAPRRGRGGSVLTPEVMEEAQKLLDAGRPYSAVGKALHIKPNTLYKAVRAGRLTSPRDESVEHGGP